VNTTTFSPAKGSNRTLFLLLCLVAAALGIFEGIYGRLHYSGDAISYLNVARAITAGNWKLALNPMWGIGYPLLVAAMSLVFPRTAVGEWYAIHLLNLVIFLAAWCSFTFLIRTATRTAGLSWIRDDARAQRFLLIGSWLIFISINLSMDNVSRVGPDMLVSCVVFLATALLMRLRESAEPKFAIVLGLVAGVGCTAKNVFLPLTLVFAVLVFVAVANKAAALKAVVLMLLFVGLIVAPYAAGLSWAFGRLTLGESGSVNYAWHVNKLQNGAFWQGYPPSFGTPIHPPIQALEKPHVYLFAEPFPVTYPPFFNPPYFYEGYRHFFKAKNQITAFAHDAYQIVKILKRQAIVFAMLLCLVWEIFSSKSSGRKSGEATGLRPLVWVAVVGIGLYLAVWVEDRYISSFFAMLLLVALFKVMQAGREPLVTGYPVRNAGALLAILALGCLGTLVLSSRDEYRDVVGHFRRHETFKNDPQWAAGLYLQQIGLQPGDGVAVIADLLSASQANWAYMDRLRIVGQLHGENPPFATDDFDVFWSSGAERQREILGMFQQAGAKLVFAEAKPAGVDAPGWTAVPGTAYWIFKF
jgi:hypothetical protein